MQDIKLTKHDFLLLAELFEKTGLLEFHFKPIEAKLLFNLDNPAEELSEFYWNITAGYIKGKILKKTFIFPPKLLILDYLDDLQYHPNATIAATLRFIERSLTSTQLLEKIQFKLNEKFEYLSSGQAKAIVKRKLKISLSSGERNDLSRLRKKFDGYQTLIDAFQDMVDKYKDSELGLLSSKMGLSAPEYISSVHSQLKFMCWECKTHFDFPITTEPVIPPMHHGKSMTISWGSHLSAKELTEAKLELEEAVQLGSHGLERIEPMNLTQDERWGILKLIKNAKVKLKSLENLPNLDKIDLNLIHNATKEIQSIDVDIDSYGMLMQKLRNGQNSVFQLERTADLNEIRENIRLVKQMLEEIEDIARSHLGTNGGIEFQPAREKAKLTPIPQEKLKETVSMIFKCITCGRKETPSWDFVKKQSNDKEDIVGIPIHCENQMSLIIDKK